MLNRLDKNVLCIRKALPNFCFVKSSSSVVGSSHEYRLFFLTLTRTRAGLHLCNGISGEVVAGSLELLQGCGYNSLLKPGRNQLSQGRDKIFRMKCSNCTFSPLITVADSCEIYAILTF